MRNVHYVVLYAALAAAAPAPPVAGRQLSGISIPASLSLPTESFSGFSVPTGFSIPTDGSGIDDKRQLSGFSIPTGLSLPTDSLSGFSIPTGFSLPTDGTGIDLNADEAVPPLTGFPTGSGFPSPTGFPSGLPAPSGPNATWKPNGPPAASGLPTPAGSAQSSGWESEARLRHRRMSSSLLSSFGSFSGLLSDATGSSVENGLDNACQPVTVIFARGTTEVSNMGTVVGPGLTTDVDSALSNKVNVQGVDYAADAAGIATEVSSSGGAGTQAMVADVTEALSKCPNTQIVLTGYSQGAMLVHNTMNDLNATAAAKVKAAVTFGDPFVGTQPKNLASGAFKSFCASGDTVCSSGVASSPSSGGTTSASTSGHLGYGSDTGTAATFIKGKVTV